MVGWWNNNFVKIFEQDLDVGVCHRTADIIISLA